MTIDALKAVKSFADAVLATTPAKRDPVPQSAANARDDADTTTVQARADKMPALNTSKSLDSEKPLLKEAA